MADVQVQGANPLDMRPEKLQGLVTELEAAGLSAEVTERDKPPGGARGVTWVEVVGVSISSVTLLAKAVAATMRWHKKRVEQKETTRPQMTTIYGPDGEELKKVETPAPKKDR
jgi:hypothetical protein